MKSIFPSLTGRWRYANAVEYRQYGTVWVAARKQCQRRGFDLCPPTSYCKTVTRRAWLRPSSMATGGKHQHAYAVEFFRCMDSNITLCNS